MIQISNPVRLAIRQEFASQFNAQLALACAPLDIEPFEIDFNAPGQFWDAPIDLDFLLEYLEENAGQIPALCLHGGGIAASGRPAVFDGATRIGGAVFLKYDLDTTDFESLPAAVESAIAGIFHESATDNWGGGTYAADLVVRPGGLVYVNGSIYRTIEFQASFQVTAN